MGNSTMILEMKGIVKKFPGVLALNGVDFDLEKGEVHALLGQNGAGKSTLIKILMGVYKKDDGTILYDGDEISFTAPQEAQENGIRAIYQEIGLVPNLNVAENIFLGHEPKNRFGKINFKLMHEKTAEILGSLNISLDTYKPLGEYSTAIQQMIAIARAINWEAKIVIMDEPTSSLSEDEVKTLFRVIDSLKKQGISIIYISHRLDEIFAVCDRVTVLRDGCKVGSWQVGEIDKLHLIQAMLGREYYQDSSKVRKRIEEKVLEIKNYRYKRVLKSVSMNVGKGEIVGLAGLIGSGRTEAMKCLFGVFPLDDGETIFKGRALNIKNPIDALKEGIAYLPEDRKAEGLVPTMSVADNIILSSLKKFSKFGIIDLKKKDKFVKEYINRLSIKTPSPGQIVNNLSGGNQQKVVLAKILLTDPDLIILDEPTRGIDIGAKAEIFNLIKGLAGEGKSIVFISSELSEVVSIADRIYVIHEGEIIKELGPEDEITEELIHEEISKT
ncbi:MAG: sugar ABC transporter ATP-binding protein [Atribacterales bacterium]